MLKRLIGTVAIWAGRRRAPSAFTRQCCDRGLERDIAAALTDETLAWALNTWGPRYL